MRNPFTWLVVSMLAATSATAVAQAPPPRTYSLTLTMRGGMTVKVARQGSRESVEQIVARSANGPGMHIRQVYDFTARKVWTMNLEGGPCTVVAYTSPEVPAMFDPIAGVAEMRAGLAQAKPAVLRTETVNGIATRVYEVPVPEINGKMRLFLDQKHDFAVKTVIVPADGKEQTQAEVSAVSFANPPVDLLVPPQNCQVQGGETNATGGHVETKIDASAQGEQKLPASELARKPAPPASKAAAASPEIEVRTATVAPAHYTGPAPAAYQFSFTVAATGPIEAQWVLVSQADTAWESGTLTFEAAGTKQLNVPVKIGVGNGSHWEGAGHLELVIGAKRISSATVPVIADCRAK